MKTDTKSLFQITEAAHACGVSRSTLMRMEEKGLLAPAYVAPESGRRYYDNHNVARVLQIEKFKSMGLGAQEIADYFVKGGEVSGLLAVLEERLQELLQGVEELRLREGNRSGMSVQLTSLHAVTCCMKKCMGRTVEEKYAAMYGFYSECIRKGCVLSDEPMFVVQERNDYLEGYIGEKPYPYWVCVPVRKEQAPEDAVVLPACRVLSVLYYGEYDEGVDEAWLTLGREVKERGLTPAGLPRVLGIVAPYTGREIEARRYCSRIVLPVSD